MVNFNVQSATRRIECDDTRNLSLPCSFSYGIHESNLKLISSVSTLIHPSYESDSSKNTDETK